MSNIKQVLQKNNNNNPHGGSSKDHNCNMIQIKTNEENVKKKGPMYPTIFVFFIIVVAIAYLIISFSCKIKSKRI
jgi:hypothetical protein